MADRFVAKIERKVPVSDLQWLFEETVDRVVAILHQITPTGVKLKGSQWTAVSVEHSSVARGQFEELLIAIEEFGLEIRHFSRGIRQEAPVYGSEHDVIVDIDAWPGQRHASNLDVAITGANKVVVDGLKVNLEAFLERMTRGDSAEVVTPRASTPEASGTRVNDYLLAAMRGSEPESSEPRNTVVRDFVQGASNAPTPRINIDESSHGHSAETTDTADTAQQSWWSRLWREETLKAFCAVGGSLLVAAVLAWLGLK